MRPDRHSLVHGLDPKGKAQPLCTLHYRAFEALVWAVNHTRPPADFGQRASLSNGLNRESPLYCEQFLDQLSLIGQFDDVPNPVRGAGCVAGTWRLRLGRPFGRRADRSQKRPMNADLPCSQPPCTCGPPATRDEPRSVYRLQEVAIDPHLCTLVQKSYGKDEAGAVPPLDHDALQPLEGAGHDAAALANRHGGV